jgi:hypothetical protein
MSEHTKTLYSKAFMEFRRAKTMLGGSAFSLSLIRIGGEGRRRDAQVGTKYRMRCINACAFIAVKIPWEVCGLGELLDYDYIHAKQTLGIWRSESGALERELVKLNEALA